jgi:hypothetical protein
MIDLIHYANRLANNHLFKEVTQNRVYTFELGERVPIRALDFSWTRKNRAVGDYNSHYYPSGFNLNFSKQERYYIPGHSSFVEYLDDTVGYVYNKKYSAISSYKTMPLMHKIGFMPYNAFTTGFNGLMYIFANTSNGKIYGYADINYQTYITAFHVYNSSKSANDYINDDDISLLEVDLSKMQLVFDKNYVDNDTLAYSNLANYLTDISAYENYEDSSIAVIDSNIKVTYVDSIYEHLTGNKLNNNNNNLFYYE